MKSFVLALLLAKNSSAAKIKEQKKNYAREYNGGIPYFNEPTWNENMPSAAGLAQ
jgi:hypothetical protein